MPKSANRRTAFRLYNIIVDKLMMHVIKTIRIYTIGAGCTGIVVIERGLSDALKRL